jgi:hypothetical protein
MTATPHLALPLLAAAQAQKHVTHNEAIAALDTLVHLAIKERGRNAPPVSPAEGDRYLVGAAPTGAFAGLAGALAVFDAGAWRFHAPRPGWRAFVEAENRHIAYAGGDWSDALAQTASGGLAALRAVEEELVLAGASLESATAIIPNRAIVFGVATRTTQALTGASSYDCGTAGETSKFGGSLGAAAGSTNLGVIGPQAFYADTPIRLTANGGAFTGGRVRLVLYYLALTAPSS